VDAAELADRFGLGRAVKLSDGPVAQGRQGWVWRLETAEGRWAVKVPFLESGEDQVRASTRFQEAACAAGVPAPSVRRATDGRVFARVGGRQVRVYEWVDLSEPDPGLDPVLVGAAVAAVHRVSIPDDGPVDPWYIAPVGADAWDRLIERLRAAGAPFAGRLADRKSVV
jgi:Ser/Thr protein kinase RdoA (MazF antagonist)